MNKSLRPNSMPPSSPPLTNQNSPPASPKNTSAQAEQVASSALQRILELSEIKGLNMTKPALRSGPLLGSKNTKNPPRKKSFTCQFCEQAFTMANKTNHLRICDAKKNASSRRALDNFLREIRVRETVEEVQNEGELVDEHLAVDELPEDEHDEPEPLVDNGCMGWKDDPRFSWLLPKLHAMDTAYKGNASRGDQCNLTKKSPTPCVCQPARRYCT